MDGGFRARCAAAVLHEVMTSRGNALSLEVFAERFPLHTPFRISRGTKTDADVVVVKIFDAEGCAFAAECIPYARYGETVDATMAELDG